MEAALLFAEELSIKRGLHTSGWIWRGSIRQKAPSFLSLGHECRRAHDVNASRRKIEPLSKILREDGPITSMCPADRQLSPHLPAEDGTRQDKKTS
jgi:hypothetical protein